MWMKFCFQIVLWRVILMILYLSFQSVKKQIIF
jgi:hypothetical protein